MNIHFIYGIIVAVTLIIFLVTLFLTSGKKDLTKSSKVEDFNVKGPKMAKKNSIKKSEAKTLAATLINEWVRAELNDELSMEQVLGEKNLSESGVQKVMDAFEDLLAVVLKKAKVEVK